MHGVSEVIAIILILMITIAVAGLAYTFMSSTMASTTAAASSAVTTTTSSMLTSFTIESIDIAKVYIRNTGQNPISSLSVYVNDEPAKFNMTPFTIAAGQIGTVAIYSFIAEGDTIKITTPNGFSASKKAPDPCAKAIGCWKFDEGTGTTAYDSSPYMNDGSLVSMEANDWVDGRYGKALRFDGTLEYVNINDAPQYGNSDEITIEMWVSVSSQDQEWEDFFYKNGDRIETAGVGGRGLWWFGTSTNNLYQYNQWFHLTLLSSYSQTRTWLYFNDVQVANSPNPFTTMPFSAGPIKIGGLDGQIFNGTIDEVRIYNRMIY